MVVGIPSGKQRSSGETAAMEEAVVASSEMTVLPELESEEEKRAKRSRTPGFQRMRLDWSSDDRIVMTRLKDAVSGRMLRTFPDAYAVLNEIYEIVRTPVTDDTGEPVRDRWGFIEWVRHPDGSYEEDFTRLTQRQKEHLLFQITTHLWDWSQRAQDAYGEALFAKTVWEERYSIGFDAPHQGTVDDRIAAGKLDSLEERYFAVFLTYFSRRADALTRSMELIGQRLRDTLTGG